MSLNLKKLVLFACGGLVVAAGFMTTGCKKDDDSPAVPATEAEIVAKLTGSGSKNWLAVNSYDLDLVTGKVSTKALLECEKDDTTTMKSNKTAIQTTGNNTCEGEDKNAHVELPWSVSVTSGIATLTLGPTGLGMTGVITELNDNTLKLQVSGAENTKATLEIKAVK